MAFLYRPISHDAAAERLRVHPAYIVAALIAVWSAVVMATRHRVPPFIDQWAIVVQYSQGLSWDWLLSPHNEHRIITARPLYLADLAWFGGQNDFLIACIATVQISAAVLFLRLSEGDRSRTRPYAVTFALALLLGLSQHQNLLQGFQICFVGVFAAGAWAIWLFASATERGVRWPRLAASWGLLLVATLTMANGVFAGFAMVALGLITRRPATATLATGALTLLLFTLYTRGLSPSSGGDPLHALTQPLALLQYVTAYLGGVFRLPGGVASAQVAGAAGLIAACGLALARDPDARASALVGVLGFVLLTAAATALGRLQFGPQQALDSRYATVGAYFWAALAILASRRASWRLLLGTALVVGLVIALWAQFIGDAVSANWFRAMETAGAELREGDNDRAVVARISHGGVDLADPAVSEALQMLRDRRLSVFRQE